MRLFRLLPYLLPLPLLSACVDDRIAYEGENGVNITIIREQKLPWDKSVELSLVVSRMPDCMRRHAIGTGTAQSKIELWQYRSDTFVIRIGDRMFATETRTCEGLEKLKEEPPGGMGTALGAYAEKNGSFAFIPEPAPAKSAAQ